MTILRNWICKIFGQCKITELLPVYERIERLEREVARERASWESLMTPRNRHE